MAKRRPGFRVYALGLHPVTGKWGGDALPQSTIIWVCYNRNR